MSEKNKRDWKMGIFLFIRLGLVVSAIICTAFDQWMASTFLLAGVIILDTARQP